MEQAHPCVDVGVAERGGAEPVGAASDRDFLVPVPDVLKLKRRAEIEQFLWRDACLLFQRLKVGSERDPIDAHLQFKLAMRVFDEIR